MICIDTNVLINGFLGLGNPDAPVSKAFPAHEAETLIVPTMAAGVFLNGQPWFPRNAYQESIHGLRLRNLTPVDLETAQHYRHIVSRLRRNRSQVLAGKSTNNPWIADIARTRGARLLTRNLSAFEAISGMEVPGYQGPS